eukprot:298808-Hanusia_phi.AAC.2
MKKESSKIQIHGGDACDGSKEIVAVNIIVEVESKTFATDMCTIDSLTQDFFLHLRCSSTEKFLLLFSRRIYIFVWKGFAARHAIALSVISGMTKICMDVFLVDPSVKDAKLRPQNSTACSVHCRHADELWRKGMNGQKRRGGIEREKDMSIPDRENLQDAPSAETAFAVSIPDGLAFSSGQNAVADSLVYRATEWKNFRKFRRVSRFDDVQSESGDILQLGCCLCNEDGQLLTANVFSKLVMFFSLSAALVSSLVIYTVYVER